MNRLGGSMLFGLPLLEPEELMARIDAVTLDDLRALADELWAPGGCRPRASAPTRTPSAPPSRPVGPGARALPQ